MKNNSKFPTSEELSALLNGTLNEVECFEMCERIRVNEPTDDKSKGIKLFLQEHQYSHSKLINWRQNAQNNILNTKKNNSFEYNAWLKYAAALILIIVSIGIIIQFTSKSERSWKSYYRIDPGFPIYMSKHKTTRWMSEYRAGDFASAKKSIEIELKTSPLNDTLNYYYTICLFELKQLNEINMPKVHQESKYYYKYKLLLGYFYWSVNNLTLAKKHFEDLCLNNDSDIRQKAETNLQQIKLEQ